jgi:GxxExxY protein
MNLEEINELSYEVRGAIFEVHNELGPGLLESIYEAALVQELKNRNLKVETQKSLPVIFKGRELDVKFRLDLLIEDQLIVEVKSVESLLDVHKKQLLTYLKLTNKKLGLLVNFNSDSLRSKRDIIRVIN